MNTAQPKYNEKELLQRIAGGNEAAFRQLFDQYTSRVYRYALSVAKVPELAEDIVSEVFVKLWMGRDGLAVISEPEGFIMRLTRNQSIDFLRKAARYQQVKQLIAHQSAAAGKVNTTLEEIQARELRQLLDEALALLSPVRRKIFHLHRNEGMTYEQIARELGLSPNTVRNNISAALQSIRQYMEERGIALSLISIILYRP